MRIPEAREILPAVFLVLASCSTSGSRRLVETPSAAPSSGEPAASPSHVTEAKDIQWEDECLVYPRQDHGLSGTALRRNCDSSEAPDSVKGALNEGIAGDERTAVGLARVVLSRLYGEGTIALSEPKALAKGDRWLVQWDVRSPASRSDSPRRLSVEILKKTGGVAKVWIALTKQ